MEKKLELLERENFDLKMRIFYMNNNLIWLRQRAASGEDAADIVVDNNQLNDAYSAALRRINELESELSELRVKRNNNTVQSLVSTSFQLEENLKTERQATQAIAEHDTVLIHGLEKELKSLRSRHESDLIILSECSQKEIELKRMIQNKDKEILKLNEQIRDLQQKIKLMEESNKSALVATTQRLLQGVENSYHTSNSPLGTI